MGRQKDLDIIHAALYTGQCQHFWVNHVFQREASHHPMEHALTLQRSQFCFYCLLHQVLMLLLLCPGCNEGHDTQFNAGWPKIAIIMCLISELVYEFMVYEFMVYVFIPSLASNQPMWSCSSLISLFFEGFCSFVLLPLTVLLRCVITTVKITKQISMNRLYRTAVHTWISLPGNLLCVLHLLGHASGRKVEMCLFKWLNSSWSNLKKTVQYSSMVQLHDSAFTHKELALWVCCLCPRRTKDLKSSKLLAYAYNFL